MPPTEPAVVTPRDIFLAAQLAPERAAAFLETCGLRDGAAADAHLQQLAADLPSRLALGEMAETLFDAFATTPDPDAALVGFCRFASEHTPKITFINNLRADPRMLEILTQILGTSPFLSEILIRNPEYLHWLHHELEQRPPDRDDYASEVNRLLNEMAATEHQVDALKRFQRREFLRIAARDLFGMLDATTLTTTTAQLSNLADALVDGMLGIASREMAARKAGPLPGRFAVIAMGKLGGGDLNYSSDIDLIYVYELPGGDDDPAALDAHERYQKLGRRLTALLSEHTAEGYLYRVDMRLRPLGQRGALVYSLQQSVHYYETTGETFERFALLKARPIAGDRELGLRFVERVAPFVFRKYLDHAAIEELARYKKRADRAHAKHGDLDANIKEGRGGIREVELFAQVFQLIYGGEHASLRTGHTLTALRELGALGFIEPNDQQVLQAAYIFLRNIEHGLQAAQGQQTHSLSGTERGLRALARRLGFDAMETLTQVLDTHRDRVHAIYANLFYEETEAEALAGRTIFRLLAGEMEDGEARQRLKRAGFDDPDSGLAALRALDAAPTTGRASARNLLSNLLATIMSDDPPLTAPNRVLIRFERVVSKALGATGLFRTLLENAGLRRRLMAGLDAGDLFAARLAAYPELLDFMASAVLDIEAFRPAVEEAFADVLADNGGGLESQFDPFRRVKAMQEFKVLVEWLALRELTPLNEKLSLVADCALRAAARAASTAPAVTARASADASDFDTGWAVLALGKLGSSELTVHSDLDLVFLYDGDPSDAERFQLHQKFVRAIFDLLSKRTAAGAAYEIDTRLRPEGKMGALAIPLVAFERYLQGRAEIWERMAWTRARFAGGDPALGEEVQAVVNRFVYGEWSPRIPAYAMHVRGRIESELAREATGDRFDLKRGKGGLADIDFLLQVLQLRAGRDDERFRVPGSRRLLASLPDSVYLPSDEADVLRDAYAFLRQLETVLRIESDSGTNAISTDPGALEPLARRLRTSVSGSQLLEQYTATTDQVRRIYSDGMARLSA
ncbi:MAG: bifunctional [glutamate--ammonia ligase]-adenylyl-L-tyrosine phosphorylase/[glutamate--ammonia-ligase] adenylyltransferase [Acidobacteria bacterium]|nr:bifunctional [glutamate--ammonia ligase]-adenylyl-L-tyrosine phosphorylase/[glutamate--ammonia-ligase] adenylyltransferase [Acidobacteriota bacterium]MYJ05918.1 bifunctional [glutamate--ammonia ligase]-adenylyl-L-tyrosine phosphorylase/[glutamate--ammonia-ligase] adenylyltransferase [Acidobacteriota bacterium]